MDHKYYHKDSFQLDISVTTRLIGGLNNRNNVICLICYINVLVIRIINKY
ncbi:hypothetical protein HS7_07730 [Sulfolobales archaeon HS-7]|nr:hypothetical protein HS7_07730 [Sulfolobales archaeon HS-7]